MGQRVKVFGTAGAGKRTKVRWSWNIKTWVKGLRFCGQVVPGQGAKGYKLWRGRAWKGDKGLRQVVSGQGSKG